MQIEIPDTMTVQLPLNAGTVQVDMTAISAVMPHIIANGLKQALGDLNSNAKAQALPAGSPKRAAIIQELANARIATWTKGAWATRATGPRGDSVLVEALELYVSTHPRPDRKKVDRIKDGRTILTGPDSDAKAKLLAAMADEIAKVRAKYDTATKSDVPSVV